ncbi:MAG: hypothetical protein JXR25_14555 [Pontiellaceae bacterium]|nr:hypothetical protein [Pontiellaceae bacterium]MBN2786041.1 hypothetical protein [Pontiellaceae bacterium]
MKTNMLLISVLLALDVAGQSLDQKEAPLMTQWAAQVNAENPLPEYPRPQLQREQWLSLNGIWEFTPAEAGEDAPLGKQLPRSILVPFPIESALSGIMESHPRAWYRRTFSIPKEWNGQQIILNFGAVDWEAEVFINGKNLGIHKGGYSPFSYDITPYLKTAGPQELIVRVFDPSEFGGQPRGKQATEGIEIMYTPCSGIWQTVWLEPVNRNCIDHLSVTPDVDSSTLKLTVRAPAADAETRVVVNILEDGKLVKKVSGFPNRQMEIKLPDPKLWSPDHPFLYGLEVRLMEGTDTVDEVASYFGMRKISVENVGGQAKMLLNNEFIFQLGALDQGYWPDGNYTAPTDDALLYDLQLQKRLGFNMIRKHVKVEPARWYYWADKLGFLVWQDMPTAQSYGGVPAQPYQYAQELEGMVRALKNHPSIAMWVVYNEKCGQDEINKTVSTADLVAMVKRIDPTRAVNQASGYDWYGVGDIADSHTYPAPRAIPGEPGQAIVSGEYGATKFKVDGHTWSSKHVLEVETEQEYLDRYKLYALTLSQLKEQSGLCGAVYTQITDVENELNGIVTYDRKAFKTDPDILREINLSVINKTLIEKQILPTSSRDPQQWHYSTEMPADNWFRAPLRSADWKTSEGPFASAGTPNIHVGTEWSTQDIWLWREFELGFVAEEDLEGLYLYLYHDDDCRVFINGVLAAELPAHRGYSYSPISAEAKKAIKAAGTNIIVVHCHQTVGGQGVDVGLSLLNYQPASDQ